MEEECAIREGQLSDCLDIARLVNESSEGAADYLLAGNNNHGESSVKIVSDMLSREVHYSYANTVVAQLGDKIIGAVLSFPASGLLVNDQIKHHYSAQQLQYIQYFAENKLKDSWHLDAICVDEKYRGNEIGKQLVASVKQQAKYYKFPMLEVFVFASNVAAIRFYRRNGFTEKKQIDTSGHEFLRDKNSLVLMCCDLSGND